VAFSDGFKQSDLSEIADELTSAMPEPQQHAIDAAEGKPLAFDVDSASAATDVELDALGIPYDPQKHSGNRAKRADGSWKRRRGTGSSIGVRAPEPAVDVDAENRVRSIEAARLSGVACANMLISLGMGLGGEEWKPRTTPIDEKPMLEEAFANYAIAKNWTDLPPGIALTFAVSVYVLPRFAMPITRSRFQKAKSWIGAKWANWRNRRALKKQGLRIVPEDGAQPASEPDDEGARRKHG
jgi:hypothetical protein